MCAAKKPIPAYLFTKKNVYYYCLLNKSYISYPYTDDNNYNARMKIILRYPYFIISRYKIRRMICALSEVWVRYNGNNKLNVDTDIQKLKLKYRNKLKIRIKNQNQFDVEI